MERVEAVKILEYHLLAIEAAWEGPEREYRLPDTWISRAVLEDLKKAFETLRREE